jgi:hypothetical protein
VKDRSVKNEHLYSLRTIRKLLELSDSIFPYNAAEWLFRVPGHEEAVDALKKIVSETKFGHDATKSLPSITERIAAYNASFKKEEELPPLLVPVPTEKELKKGKKEKQPVLAEVPVKKPLEKVRPIGVLEWASFYKHIMQNGCLLDLTSIKVNAAWHIFLHQLRKIHTAFTKEELTKSNDGAPAIFRLNEEGIRKIWLEFIGQLCTIDEIDSARVIHSYIHLATKIVAGQKANGMTPESAGSMVLSVLLSGLDLSEVLVLPENNTFDGKYQAAAAAHRFFPRVAPFLITMPHFEKPFDPSLYIGCQQNRELYASTLAAAQKLIWEDVVKLEVPLNEVSFQSPREEIQKAPAESPLQPPLPQIDIPKRFSQEKKPTFLKLFQAMTVSSDSLLSKAQPNSPQHTSNRGSPSRGTPTPDSPVRERGTIVTSQSGQVDNRVASRPINIVRTHSDPKMSPPGPKVPALNRGSPLSTMPVSFAGDLNDSQSSTNIDRPLTPRYSARLSTDRAMPSAAACPNKEEKINVKRP